MALPCLGQELGGKGGRIIPGQEHINGPPDTFRHRHAFLFCSSMKTFKLLFGERDSDAIQLFNPLSYTFYWCILRLPQRESKGKR